MLQIHREELYMHGSSTSRVAESKHVLEDIPDILAIQLADGKNDWDDDKGDNREAPGGSKHKEEHHGCLCHTPQRHIQVEAHLV